MATRRIALATAYVSSAGQAYDSLQWITNEAVLGHLLRGMHYFGASAMVLLVCAHAAQVFLIGAFKYPREVNWLSGTFLLIFTFGMAFTGQVLRFDQDAYWGLGIGASITSRIPFIGGSLVHLLLGGPIIAERVD